MRLRHDFIHHEQWASPTGLFREQWARASRALAQGRLEAAEARCSAILSLWPRAVAALHMTGMIARRRNLPYEALAAFEGVLAIDPTHVEALIDAGGAHAAVGETGRAVACYRAALAIEPAQAAAHFNLGNALVRLGQVAEAAEAFAQAAALAPAGSAVAMRAAVNQSSALSAADRDDEALPLARAALAQAPDAAEAAVALSMILLKLGRFEEGWPLYEQRLRVGDAGTTATPGPAAPLWTGAASLAGKRILLRHEQGFGDTIQFVRYVPMLVERGATVFVEAPPPLAPLLRGMRGVAAVIEPGTPPPPHDLSSFMASLPFAFGTRVETIPAAVPYLSAEPERVAAWSARLGPRTGPRVGLAWSGAPGNIADARRSMPATHLRPLLERAGVSFFSLQPETTGEDADALADFPAVTAHARLLTDFAETAALASLMDAVVTVDTSAAHLAGALGRPTWLLLPTGAEWRWMAGRDDSPWYPTMRLLRQPAPGAWDAVVARAAAAIEALAIAS